MYDVQILGAHGHTCSRYEVSVSNPVVKRAFERQRRELCRPMTTHGGQSMIVVCLYHLVMIRIERSETAQKSTLEIGDNSVQDKMQSKTKFSLRIFFRWSEFFFFWTKFYLSLYLSQTEFCLGLNFVSDYIPELYFVCNLYIV